MTHYIVISPDVPRDLRAEVLLERAHLRYCADDIRAGLPPAVAVALHYGNDRPDPQPAEADTP